MALDDSDEYLALRSIRNQIEVTNITLRTIRNQIEVTNHEIGALRMQVAELKECLQVMSMIKSVEFYFQTSIDKDELKELYDRFCGLDTERRE